MWQGRKQKKLTDGSGEPRAQGIPLQVVAAVSHPDFQVLKGLVAAAPPGGHPDDFDRVRAEEIDGPPRTSLLLGLGAPFAVVVGALVAVVGVQRPAAPHRRRLIDGLAIRHVRS